VKALRKTAEFAEFTPSLAAEYLAKYHYEHQRNLHDWHAVGVLAQAMRREWFRDGTVIELAICGGCETCNSGREALIDGMHTLHAIVHCSLSQELLVLRRWVGSCTDIRMAYATHGRGLGRSPSEILKALGVAEQFGLNDHDLDLFYAAIALVIGDFRAVSVRSNAAIAKDVLFRAGRMQEWLAAAMAFLELTRSGFVEADALVQRKLRYQSVMAVGLATYMDAPEEAALFRPAIVRDRGKSGSAVKAAVHYLVGLVNRGSPLNRVRNLATCWNFFYDDRELAEARASFSGMVGITLKGTRFHARHVQRQPPRRHLTGCSRCGRDGHSRQQGPCGDHHWLTSPQHLGDIGELAASIETEGLLEPIGITEAGRLVFGQRRVEAFKCLGRAEIPARIVNVTSITAGEYHENEMRKDFTPSERAAILETIKRKAERRPNGNSEDLPSFPEAAKISWLRQ
jgi:hypothetical protein